MSDTVIEVENASKLFKLYHNPISGPVKEILFPWRRNEYYESFWAVKDVNMQIKRGEVVGIIGPNGAGKTTLLKMIAGLLPVDKGRITVRGKITALLALGVGVHPEFTGLENILYGAMLLGMSKQEVLAKMKEIVEFAELGDFINHPFRTYSSGMKARLLFAISMSIVPDILIIDEALATGDSYFLAKSRKKILDLCNSGATILFVSHNLAQIQELCSRAYFMAEGEIKQEGYTYTTLASYHQYHHKTNTEVALSLSGNDLVMINGNKKAVVTNIEMLSRHNIGYYSGEPFCMAIDYKCFDDNLKSYVFIGIIEQSGMSYVGEFNSINYINGKDGEIKHKICNLNNEGRLIIKFDNLLLLNNTYSLWIILYYKNEIYCEYKNIKPFRVSRKNNSVMSGDAFFWHPGEIIA